MCVDNEECVWYTYDSDDSACILLNNCPDVFTDCTTCVYGHRLCDGKASKVGSLFITRIVLSFI